MNQILLLLNWLVHAFDEVESNVKVGKIQFNNTKIQDNTTNVYEVTENIFIKFADLPNSINISNSSLYTVNSYRSSNPDGTYENGKEYTFRIVSGTGIYVKAKGYINIKPVNDMRHITIRLCK
jgi:hypothetical protein